MSGRSSTHQLEEIAKYLDQMKRQKQGLQGTIRSLEEEREGVERQISSLTERRGGLESRIQTHTDTLHHLEITIKDSEATYLKLLESTQTLAAFMKKETEELSLRKDGQ